jgi:hypothetical protein
MKIKTGQITRENSVLSHILLNALNEEANKIIQSNPNRDANTEYEVTLTFEGVELDITKFTKRYQDQLEQWIENESLPQAQELFEKWKHKYQSKNSSNAKLQKIKTQLENANLQLQNIQQAIANLDIKVD